MLKTRLTGVSDAEELKKLNDLFNVNDSSNVETIKKSLEENSQEIVCVAVCEDEQKIVGFCCGQVVRSMCYLILYGDITEFFVIEKYRKQEICKQLINQMEREFALRGVNHLHHIIGKDNLPLRALFRELGYTDTTESSYGSPSISIFEKDTVFEEGGANGL